MKVRLKDEESFKRNLRKSKKIIEELLQMDLKEKELNEVNLKKMQEMKRKVLELHYIDMRDADVQIIGSDNTEPTNINCF